MVRYVLVILDEARHVKAVKGKLEEEGLLNRHIKIARSNQKFHIFTKCSEPSKLVALKDFEPDLKLGWYETKKETEKSLGATVLSFLSTETDISEKSASEMALLVPKRWSVYPPMVLFPARSFETDMWTAFLATGSNAKRLFEHLKKVEFGSEITHFAVNKPISDYVMRRPLNLLPLYGDFGPVPTEDSLASPSDRDIDSAFWCTVIQNGIFQIWAPRYTMFSRGNIKEKKRILDKFQDVDGKVVVDLYAGIGYFALSYLKRCATVFCWELNPWSIRGLIKGVSANNYKFALISRDEPFDRRVYDSHIQKGTRVFIFEESNEHAAERLAGVHGVLEISHINMGLLPSSQPVWPVARTIACDVSSLSEVTLHIHENSTTNNFTQLSEKAMSAFPNSSVVHLEKVKTYAPDVWHIVLDLKIISK